MILARLALAAIMSPRNLERYVTASPIRERMFSLLPSCVWRWQAGVAILPEKWHAGGALVV